MIKVTADHVQDINAGEVIHSLLERVTGEGANKRRAAILENITPDLRQEYLNFASSGAAEKYVFVRGVITDPEVFADALRHVFYDAAKDSGLQNWTDLALEERAHWEAQALSVMAEFVVIEPIDLAPVEAASGGE
jgi:hypothetical protein